ncbi:MAG TPA: hypothetical protein VKA30_03545 [Actinomycetota bacterium]|nr:hypothetical protein [Actinomycetota bacterium]
MSYPEEHIELPDPNDPAAPVEPRISFPPEREEELPDAQAETA